MMLANPVQDPGDAFTYFGVLVLRHVKDVGQSLQQDISKLEPVRSFGDGAKRDQSSVPLFPILSILDLSSNELNYKLQNLVLNCLR